MLFIGTFFICLFIFMMRVDELCPYVKGLLKWENYCKDVGLDKERTKALFT